MRGNEPNSSCGLIVWFGIGITYLRFFYGLKAQGIDRRELPYRAPLQPYLAMYSISMIFLILLFANYTVFIKGHWDTASFITSYLVRFRLAPSGFPWLIFFFSPLHTASHASPERLPGRTRLEAIHPASSPERVRQLGSRVATCAGFTLD